MPDADESFDDEFRKLIVKPLIQNRAVIVQSSLHPRLRRLDVLCDLIRKGGDQLVDVFAVSLLPREKEGSSKSSLARIFLSDGVRYGRLAGARRSMQPADGALVFINPMSNYL